MEGTSSQASAALLSFETRAAGILPSSSPFLTKKSGNLSHAAGLLLLWGLRGQLIECVCQREILTNGLFHVEMSHFSETRKYGQELELLAPFFHERG